MAAEVEIARHRLWAMHADLHKSQNNTMRGVVRWISRNETDALRTVLEELHRMNKVADTARKQIKALRKKILKQRRRRK